MAAVTMSRMVLVVYLLVCNLIRLGSMSTELLDQKVKIEESDPCMKRIILFHMVNTVFISHENMFGLK